MLIEGLSSKEIGKTETKKKEGKKSYFIIKNYQNSRKAISVQIIRENLAERTLKRRHRRARDNRGRKLIPNGDSVAQERRLTTRGQAKRELQGMRRAQNRQ